MRTGWLSLVGIVLVLPLLVGTLRGDVTLEATALRIVALVVALALIDRLAIPAFGLFLASLRPGDAALDADETSPMEAAGATPETETASA